MDKIDSPMPYAIIIGNVTRTIVMTLGGVNTAERTRVPTVTARQFLYMVV